MQIYCQFQLELPKSSSFFLSLQLLENMFSNPIYKNGSYCSKLRSNHVEDLENLDNRCLRKSKIPTLNVE